MQVGFPLPHTAPHAVAGPPDGWPRRIAISVMAPRSITVSWLGQVASLGERRLTDRFGLEGRWAWRLCTGTDDEAIYPMAFVETVVERMSLSFPTSLVHALSLAVDTLLRRAYARPEMRGGGTRGRVSLRCAATGWPSWERSILFREPAGTWESASYAVRSRLESDPPDTPVEEVAVTLSSLTGEHGTQMGIFDGPRRDRERRIAETERRLRDRLGGVHALYRVEEVAPWHPAPEMRALQGVPVDPSAREAIRPLHSPEPVEVREKAEGEPVSMLYRKRWRHVARIDDRWMFDLWWLPRPVTRTYYRVDPGDGVPITVFRDEWSGRGYRQSA